VKGTGVEFSVVIPTLNGGSLWRQAAAALSLQQPAPSKILVIDSGSTDDTVQVANQAGFQVTHIPQAHFDHGGTRNRALEQLDSPELVVYLTQDCVLSSNDAIARLIEVFSDEKVAVAFGRQIPRSDASPTERHAREFNYPAESNIKTKEDINSLGIKTAFCSNVFAAYRTEMLKSIGGFPDRTIISEDMYAGAKLILAGYKVAYAASAECLHSHNYSILEDFRRSFDIGVFQSRERWLVNEFGRSESEGMKYSLSCLKDLAAHHPLSLPLAICRIAMRLVGFRLGWAETRLSLETRRRLSLNRGFWFKEPQRSEKA
jgi:rhamnosyltransferase